MVEPLIGVTTCLDPGVKWRPGVDYIYVARAYGAAVRRAGGVPVLLTLDGPSACVSRLAGVVLTGGDDLPTRLGGDMSGLPGTPEVPQRIEWDLRLVEACLTAGVPLLGICYGMQLINLFLGGSLYAAIASDLPHALQHGGSGVTTRHNVRRLADSSWLDGLPALFECNSRHGQAVNALAPGLRPIAECVDGVLEAFDGDAVCGIEWHPETDPTTSDVIYSNFVRHCQTARP